MFAPIEIPYGCVMMFNVVDLKDGVTVADVELALGEIDDARGLGFYQKYIVYGLF